jgi:hypothetical protein
MLNSRLASMQLPPVIEPAAPAVIVQNFRKGLLLVRTDAEPVAPPVPVTVIIQTQIRTPKLVQLPPTVTPRKWLFLSALLHTATAAMAISVPILFPAWFVSVPSAAADLDYDVEYQPVLLPILPTMAPAGAGAKIEHGSRQKAYDTAETLPTGARPTANQPTPDYAGPQLIVSNPSDSTKGVQTIRRPDLAVPPKLKYPLRLPSVVMLPTPATPALVAPRLERPVSPNPEALSPFRPMESLVPTPALPVVARPKLSLDPAKPVLPKTKVTSAPNLPVLAAAADPGLSTAKGLVVINAVSIPPQPVPLIPDAELASRFVVGPSGGTTGVMAAASEATRGNPAGPSNARENLPHPGGGNGTGTRVDASDPHAGVASPDSSSSVGPRLGSAAGTAAGAAAGNKGLPGISISGGTPGRSGRTVATNSIPRASYGLTVISGGSSGGATRDLGVFSRSDTVYTVYIPMTDAGGGPDWPMQYAVMNPAQARSGLLNGLLTPPAVLKKNPAMAPKTELGANSGPVFVTGIVDDNGKLGALRAVRAADGRAQFALDALEQWEFMAAQLDGKAVACKVLIGITVMPAEEVGK